MNEGATVARIIPITEGLRGDNFVEIATEKEYPFC